MNQILETIPSKKNINQIALEVVKSVKPPPKLTVTQWADRERVISPEISSEPGDWDTNRAPYQREIMNVFNDPSIHTIVVMASSQVGKTEILNNIIGFTIDKDPGPIMVVQPTLKLATEWSKERLTPMLRDTPCLKDKIPINKRHSDNEILHKKFPGGNINITGANSPSSLASRPARILLMDEVDRYPVSAGTEGDPAHIAIKRTTTFWNRKIVYVSTPTIKNASRIDNAYQESDQRKFLVPCPHCNIYQELSFWQLSRPKENALPEEWDYVCKENGCIIEEKYKIFMLRKGIWEKSKETKGIAGFWIHEVYSPWVSWSEMVKNFLQKKKLPDQFKTFINTSLAELWDEDMEGEGINKESLIERTEQYQHEIPEGVYLITCAIDVQDNRFEMEFLGWGMDRETWSLKYIVKYVDPGIKDAWEELDHLIEQDFLHSSGMPMKAIITTIDAGGHHTESTYKWVKKKAQQKKRVYAVRGSSISNQPILAKKSRNNAYRVLVHFLGTDTAKEMIYSQLKIEQPGAGYMHFPDHYDEDYFKQLTCERKVTTYERGKTRTKWIKPKHKRNEALDLKVYNFAAYWILKADMKRVKDNLNKKVEKWKENNKLHDNNKQKYKKDDEEQTDTVHNKRKTRSRKKRTNNPRSGFVTGWNRI